MKVKQYKFFYGRQTILALISFIAEYLFVLLNVPVNSSNINTTRHDLVAEQRIGLPSD